MKFIVYFTFLLASTFALERKSIPLESDDIIDYINNANTTWKAGHNFNQSLKLSDLTKFLNAKKLERPLLLPMKQYDVSDYIPGTFDARIKWSRCSSISEIHDQGACGSCWAVAAADAFTDRICIANRNGSWDSNKHISAQDLLSCCYSCGDCNGGYIELAWNYFVNVGVVTGGFYGSREGCRPYSFEPCEHHVHGPRKNCADLRPVVTPQCNRQCVTNRMHYNQDIHRAFMSYWISDITLMQNDLMTRGPITAVFRVYADFPSYKSGVYQHITGEEIGSLAVRLIGWGSENGIPYWLVANSFNTDWGDQGFFRIRRGNNECGIEEYVFTGLPYDQQ